MSERQAVERNAAHGAKAEFDALSHGDLAEAIAGHIESLPRGAVIAVQGSWGRGKTDVVTRVFDRFAAGGGPAPIWIDPWQYARPDLIQPVIVELLTRTRDRPADKKRMLRATARTLLRASNAMAFKAASVFVPFGSILEAAQEPFDDLISAALDDGRQEVDPDADPVHEMAVRFRELVDEVVDPASEKPLLICVDDLDRCLPDHQIAMLEAIHFLTSAHANCAFLVAIDPLLVQQAAFAHYRTDALDINQYLDKLFELRVNLTALRDAQIAHLVAAEFNRNVAALLKEGLGADPEQVQAAFGDVFFVLELANPRLVHRAFERLRLAAAANVRAGYDLLRDPRALESVVAWCAIAERWPQLRQLLQASNREQWHPNLIAVAGYYGQWGDEEEDRDKTAMLGAARNITDRLPGQLKQPDLGYFLSDLILSAPAVIDTLQKIDAIFTSLGL
jgi:KAP family P-loop domain